MSFSETGGAQGDALPPLPDGIIVPDTAHEVLQQFAAADVEDLNREKESLGHRWDRLTKRLRAVDDEFGTDEASKVSFHDTGGQQSTRVLVNTIYTPLEQMRPQWAAWMPKNPSKMAPAWDVIINERKISEDGVETIRYREFTLLKDFLRIIGVEEEVDRPVGVDWTFQSIGSCALLTPRLEEGVCHIDRGTTNRLMVPRDTTLIPGNMRAAKSIGGRIDALFGIVAGLSAGTHEEQISAVQVHRGQVQ